MRITAEDVLELGCIDGIVPEPGEGAHTNPENAADALGIVLRETLRELSGMTPQELIDDRGCASRFGLPTRGSSKDTRSASRRFPPGRGRLSRLSQLKKKNG